MTSLQYSRGYFAGSRGKWPEHKPPFPPNAIVAGVLKAGMELRDEYDAICATFSDDDPLVQQLSPVIDRFDAAMSKITEWLRSPVGTPEEKL